MGFTPSQQLLLSESKLRDYLAENLGILEEGLTLIEKEHRLENRSSPELELNYNARRYDKAGQKR